jgi:hypothetical protein
MVRTQSEARVVGLNGGNVGMHADRHNDRKRQVARGATSNCHECRTMRCASCLQRTRALLGSAIACIAAGGSGALRISASHPSRGGHALQPTIHFMEGGGRWAKRGAANCYKIFGTFCTRCLFALAIDRSADIHARLCLRGEGRGSG